MIAYDLECEHGHRFEGWFDSADSFCAQHKKGLVNCPVCGSAEVNKMLSTFGIAKHREVEKPPKKPSSFEQFVKYVEDNFEDVGIEFAKEALKMHYGVTDYRNIRGVSSDQEEETLRQEGVPFFKFPNRLPPVSEPDEE